MTLPPKSGASRRPPPSLDDPHSVLLPNLTDSFLTGVWSRVRDVYAIQRTNELESVGVPLHAERLDPMGISVCDATNGQPQWHVTESEPTPS